MKKPHLLSCCAWLLAPMTVAFGAENCDYALQPRITQTQDDYRLAQAYMYVNAEKDYELRKSQSGGSSGGSAAYGMFDATYRESKSASDYAETVRSRLRQEGFSMDAQQAATYYRKDLSSEQLEAWSKCVAGGGLLLRAIHAHQSDPFPIRIEWMPPRGVARVKLQLKTVNATIDNKNVVSVSLDSRGDNVFTVSPRPGQRQIVITAQVPGYADQLVFPRPFPPHLKVQLVPITIVSTGMGLQSSDSVFPIADDKDQMFTLSRTFGNRVIEAKWIPESHGMPPNGVPGYVGYLTAKVDKNGQNRVVLSGALYKNTPEIKGHVRVVYED